MEVKGLVRARPEGTRNENLISGGVEVLAQELKILNPSAPPPFLLDDENLSETTRLTYRVLDLRRLPMQRNMSSATKLQWLSAVSLTSTASSTSKLRCSPRALRKAPRDYLVPSRIHDGHFYALPQSPQLFKQMLMCAGFDRYYQIVKCFRDEDLRADRQPEFTQVDIETSFLNEVEIRALMEELIRAVFKEAINVDLPNPFPIMLWTDAMNNYGSDKPDLRVKLKLTDLTDLMSNVDFKVFRSATELNDGRVMALRVPHGASMPRSEIDGYTEFVKIYGAKGLAYIKVNDIKAGREGLQSPIVKNLSDDVLKAIIERTGAQTATSFSLAPTARRSFSTPSALCV